MSLSKILEYQAIDMPIYKEQIQLNKSAEAQRMVQLKSQYAETTAALAKIDYEAGELFSNINSLSEKLNGIIQEDRTDFSFNSVTDIAQVDNIGKALGEYKDEIATIEKNLAKYFKRLDEISSEMTKLAARCKAISVEQNKLHAVQMEKTQLVLAKYKDELAKLAALMKEMEPNWLKKYKELRAAKRMPAFVRYIGGSCEGCGMNIEAEVNGKMKNSGDVAECPNCRRIIFIE